MFQIQQQIEILLGELFLIKMVLTEKKEEREDHIEAQT